MVKWKVLSKTTYAWSEAKAFKGLPSIGYQRKLQLQPLPLSLFITVPNPREGRSSGRGGGGRREEAGQSGDLSPSAGSKPTGLA